MHLQYILNRLPIGLILLDRDYKVTGFSGIAASVFGEAALGGNIGRPIEHIHSSHAQIKIDMLFREAEREGSSGFASLLVNMPSRILQLRMIQMRDGNGISGYSLLFYDITEMTSGPQGEAASETAPFFRLPISSGGRIALIDVEQISYLQADGHYAKVCAEGTLYFCNMSLSQIEARLPADRFVRVHRSYIVNIGRAASILHRDDQYLLSMEKAEDREIPVSRAHLPHLRRLLGF